MLGRLRISVGRLNALILRLTIALSAATLFSTFASAQAPLNSPSQILQQYQSQQIAWFGGVQASATKLFTLLAGIEVAWTLTLVALERADFQSLAATLIRKIMWIGIFYALLINGQNWIPWIIQSFGILGQRAAGVNGTIAPSNVLSMGLNIFGALLSGASNAGFLTNFGTAVSLVLAAFVTLLAYVVITIQFVAAMVESYIVIAAGFIFLGFGGSRWTMPYVERYIGLAVSIGVKLMMLYLLIGVGMNLSNGWLNAAAQVANAQSPAMSAGDIAGACIIFMALCWMSPKLISGVIGGSPAFSGGDLLSPQMAVASVGATGAAIALGAAGIGWRVASGGAAGMVSKWSGSLTGTAAKPAASPAQVAPLGSTISRGSTALLSAPLQPSPPRSSGGSGSSGTGGSSSGQVSPPSSYGSSQTIAQRGSAALRRVSQDLRRINLSDGGHHHAPPPGFGGGHGEGEG